MYIHTLSTTKSTAYAGYLHKWMCIKLWSNDFLMQMAYIAGSIGIPLFVHKNGHILYKKHLCIVFLAGF